MQIFPGGSFDWEKWQLKSNFTFSIWIYIEMNLKFQKINEKDLIDLFDITPSALQQWKTGKREISQDKLVVLCNMFGVTIDQMLERDFSDDYAMEDMFRLSKFDGKVDSKEFTEGDFESLFENINRAMFEIEYFALGYIPFDPDDENPDAPDREYIGGDEVEYYCNSLDIDVTYDLSDGKKVTVNSINYLELCKVADLLKSLWGDESYNHIDSKPNKKYDVMLLKSENAKALKSHIEQYGYKTNSLFELWRSLKDEDSNYDKDFLMGKVLLANGTCLLKDAKPDLEGTIELFRKIASIEVKKL